MWYAHVWQWLREHLTITVPGVLLVFTATWILVLAIQSGVAGAAWVQAFGSIGAIGVAIWVAERSHRRDRLMAAQAEAKESFRVAELAWQSARECHLAITQLQEQLDKLHKCDIQKINLGRLNQAAAVLRSVLQHKLDAVLVAEAFKVLAHAGELQMEVGEWTPISVPEGAEGFLTSHAVAVNCSYKVMYSEYIACAGSAAELVTRTPRP